jgi:hypothetical protein
MVRRRMPPPPPPLDNEDPNVAEKPFCKDFFLKKEEPMVHTTKCYVGLFGAFIKIIITALV